jgi:hypothetical protein
MMENATCQHTLPYYHSLNHLFDRKKVLGKLTSVWRWQRFLCKLGRAAAAVEEEEAGIEVAAEETSSSSVDGDRGDWWSTQRWSRERLG